MIARDDLLLERGPVGGSALQHEAALGAGGNDDGVLHHLGLYQAQHLGAEVLVAIRPAQPAAGDRPRS